LGIASISQQQARVLSVATTNVTPTSSPIVAITNVTLNQPRNVAMTHASTNAAWPNATIA
jgi:hypothetical protein